MRAAGGCAARTGPVERGPFGTFPHAPPRLRHGSLAPPAASCGRTGVSGVEAGAGGRGRSSRACGGGTRARGREGSSDFSKPPPGLGRHPRRLPPDSRNWFFFAQRIPGSRSGGGGRGDPQLFFGGNLWHLSQTSLQSCLPWVIPGRGARGKARRKCVGGTLLRVVTNVPQHTVCACTWVPKFSSRSRQTEAQRRAAQPSCPQLGGAVALP